MITLTTSGDSVVFNFDNNGHYLQEGTIEVPKNSLSLVIDSSDMVTFKKAASNDVFVSATLAELGMTKAELETWFKENAVGGGSIDSGAVQTMIDNSVSGYADSVLYNSTSKYVEFYHGGSGGTKVYEFDASDFVIDGMIDDVRIETISGVSYLVIDFNTASGKEDIQIPLTDIFNPSDYYTTAQTDTKIAEATSGKVDTSTYTAYTAATEAVLSGKQDTLSAGTNITISGNVISAEGGGVDVVQTTGTSTADVMSQDAVTTGLNNKANKTAAFGGYKFGSYNNANYIQYRNVNNDNIGNSIYYPKINGKGILTNNSTWAENNYNFSLVETSAVTSAVTSASTDSEIPTAKAVYDAIPTSGGGKAISAGTNISITTGETADTINCTLPIYSGGSNSIAIGGSGNTINGWYNLLVGDRNRVSYSGDKNILVGESNSTNMSSYCAIFGYYNTVDTAKNNCFVAGYDNYVNNSIETAFGNACKSIRNSYSFGDSGNTLFSVGNGYDSSKRHNALEIRQNGDIYIADTNDTSTSNFYEKPMIKLQDALGGGSVSSAVTSGDTNAVSSDAVYTAMGGLKLQQITQADYDALISAGTVDASTLYIITNVVN